MRPVRIVWLALAAALPAACTSGSSETSACRAFTTSLSVEDRMGQAASVFNPNEPIAFELSVTNTQNAPATLTAGSPCSAVVFEVADSAQQRRWGSADGIVCIQMLQPRTYSPLETVRYSAEWDQRDTGGALVAPGTYRVSAAVGQYAPGAGGLVDCREALGRAATFRIE